MIPFDKECGLKLVKDVVRGDESLSRIYGFILYTDKDPYVAKVLRDEDFWQALNSISGPRWPIFAVRPLRKGAMSFPKAIEGMYQLMVPTWDEPSENSRILMDFGIKDSRELPLFIAFMWDDEDNLNQISVPINGDTVEDCFASIRETVETITTVESEIDPKYKRTVNVFRNVKAELESRSVKVRFINTGKTLFRLAEFLSTISALTLAAK